MDLSRLNSEMHDYWENRDFPGALHNIQTIDDYISGGNFDTWLSPYPSLFEPSYLIGLYNQETGMGFEQIAKDVSYKSLLENFRQYIQGLINEVKEIDEDRKRFLRELDNDIFSQIGTNINEGIKNVSEGFKIFSVALFPMLLIGLGFIIYSKSK